MESFEDIIESFHPLIYKISRAYTDNDFDFKDLYQEIIIQIWKAHKTFKGNSKLSTFVYRVSLNTSLNYRKSNKIRGAKIKYVDIPEYVESERASVEKKEDIDILYKCISGLKKVERAVVLLYLENEKYEEIAKITGLTTSNVGVMISRIKKKLFISLNEAGYERN